MPGAIEKRFITTTVVSIMAFSLLEIRFFIIEYIFLRVKARRFLALFDDNVGNEKAAAFDASNSEIDEAKLKCTFILNIISTRQISSDIHYQTHYSRSVKCALIRQKHMVMNIVYK